MPFSRSRAQSRRLAYAASTLVPLALLGGVLTADWHSLESAVRQDVIRQAQIVREHAAKVFDTSELTLDRIQDRFEGRPWPELITKEGEIHQFLASLADPLPQVSNIFLIDPDGVPQISAATFPANKNYNVLDRDYFIEQRAMPRKTYVGEQIVGRARGKKAFSMSRRLVGADGKFNGVIYVGVSEAYLADYWRENAGADDDAIALIRTDGAVLARYPSSATVTTLPFDFPVMDEVRDRKTGVEETVSPIDNGHRITGIVPMGGYDVSVAYGRSYDGIVRAWRARAAWLGLAAFAAGLVLNGAAWLLIRRADAERLMLLELAQEEARRRKAEADLNQAQKLDMLGQMTGGISHDFNNLLAVVQGTLTALRGRVGDPRLEQRVVLALKAVDKGTLLVGQLLAFAKRKELTPRLLDIQAVLDGLAPMIRQALGSACTLELRTTGKLPPVLLDPTQLEMAILNMAVNARHAMPSGGVFRVEATCQAGDVVLRLSDSGVGIPPEVQHRIFEPFFTTRPEGEGTGLGLAMVFGFVKQSGGRIELESSPGSGAEFTLHFPPQNSPTGPEQSKVIPFRGT